MNFKSFLFSEGNAKRPNLWRKNEQGQEELKCNRCGEFRTLDNYNEFRRPPNPKTPEGRIDYRRTCKICSHRGVNYKGARDTCSICGKSKKPEEMATRGLLPSGKQSYMTYCKDCSSEKAKNRVYNKKCEVCGKPFTTKQSYQKLCDEHKQEAHEKQISTRREGKMVQCALKGCPNKFYPKGKNSLYCCIDHFNKARSLYYDRSTPRAYKCWVCGVEKNNSNHYKSEKLMACSLEHRRIINGCMKWKEGIYTQPSAKYIKMLLVGKKCEECGLDGEWIWNDVVFQDGKYHYRTRDIKHKVPLQLHHIDGNSNNNVPSNLQILCCNCHAQTDTYLKSNKVSGRKIRKQSGLKLQNTRNNLPFAENITFVNYIVNERNSNESKIKKRRFIFDRDKNKCISCGRKHWNGDSIPLQIDHVDGNNKNNDESNLRTFCVNCHACTPTFMNRNKKYITLNEEEDKELFNSIGRNISFLDPSNLSIFKDPDKELYQNKSSIYFKDLFPSLYKSLFGDAEPKIDEWYSRAKNAFKTWQNEWNKAMGKTNDTGSDLML